MSSQEVISDYLPLVEAFLERVEKSHDDEERERELQKVSHLIRFARDFYKDFFKEYFNVSITSFAYSDKRRVSRRLVRAEQELDPEADKLAWEHLWLAQDYEELCDALHGDIEFGYSDSDESYTEFHHEEFPRWLYQLVEWLGAIGSDLETRVNEVTNRYVGAV